MPTDDLQILVTGSASAPASHKIPGNGQIRPKAIFAHYDGGSAASTFLPAIKIISDGGEVVGIYPAPSVAAAGSADVSWFPGADLDEAVAAAGAGVIVETFYVPSNTGTPVTSSTTLQSGRAYILTVQGTYTVQNHPLPFGSPQPDAMFPTSTAGRVSLQVGLDAETIFANDVAFTPGHTNQFAIDTGDGQGLIYRAPVGGPFATPQPNFFYTYNVTGAGTTLRAQIFDSVYTDNYGKLLVTIQTVGGGSSGGGAGSLMPDPSLQPNGAWLRTSSGTAVWSATPQVAETDLNFTDVTTANVSTGKHGLAPKAPNDATKYLDGTGAYTVPTAGTSPLTTKGDIYVYSTTNTRLPVGSNSQVLISDSAQTTGLRWGAVPAGSGVPTTELSLSAQVGGNIQIANTSGTSAEIAAGTGGPGTGGFDLTIAAATGDHLLITGSINLANLQSAQQVGVDIATMVSGSVVSWVGRSAGSMVSNSGLAFTFPAAVDYSYFGISVIYVVVSGDVSGGNVVLRAYYGSSATHGVFGCSVGSGPLLLGVSNLK